MPPPTAGLAPEFPEFPVGTPDIAVAPQALTVSAAQLRRAADALPAAAARLRAALSAVAAAAGPSRSAPPLGEHAVVTTAAVSALAEQVLGLARALDVAAGRYHSADVDVGRSAAAVPGPRRPR